MPDELKLDDLVCVRINLRNSCHADIHGVTREAAMKMVRDWWRLKQAAIENLSIGFDSPDNKVSARDILQHMAFAGTRGKFTDHHAVEWGAVVAMTINEYPPKQLDDAQQRAYKAWEKMLKKMTRNMDRGDEWRSDEDE